MLTFTYILFSWVHLTSGQACTYKSPDNSTLFDLTALTLSPEQGDYMAYDSSTSITYTLNICSPCNSNGGCKESKSDICSWAKNMTFMASVSKYGVFDEWSLLDFDYPSHGLILTSNNGPNCTDPASNQTYPTRSHILLRCNRDAPLTTRMNVTIEKGGCIYHFSLVSPNACPVQSVTTLDSKKAVTFTGSAGKLLYYQINVTRGIYELRIDLTSINGSGSVVLYVRRGALPTNITYDQSVICAQYDQFLQFRNDDQTPLLTGIYYIAAQVMDSQMTATLQATTWLCPQDCSGHGTCNSGKCVCDAGYQTNREDCSARIVDLNIGQSITATIEGDMSIIYFRVNVDNPSFYQLSAIMKKVNGSASPALMMAYGKFPALDDDNGTFVDWDQDPFAGYWDLHVYAPFINQGTWIVGVMASRDVNFTFQLLVNLYNCKNGCSNHGTCNTVTHVCTCEEEYRALDDCSVRNLYMRPQQQLMDTVTSQQWSYFRTNVPTNLTSAVNGLVIAVKSNNASVYPSLYISPTSLPTLNSYYNFSVPSTFETSLSLDAKTLLTDGGSVWYIGVHNPNNQTSLTFSIKMYYEGTCPTSCTSPHGTCNSLYPGLCECNAGWQGEGCDVGIASDTTSFSTEMMLLLLGMIFILSIPIYLLARWYRGAERSSLCSCCARSDDYASITPLQHNVVSKKGSINKDLKASYVYSTVFDNDTL